MTLQMYRLDRRRAVRSGLAGAAIAVGLVAGFGSPAALADDTETTADAGASPASQTGTPQTADEVLAIIARDYDLGAGGGQLSTLIHDVMGLRAQGFYPSGSNKNAIVKALDYRPNQKPLVDALQETLAYQRKLQARAQNADTGQQPAFNFGVGQPPGVPPNPGQNSGVFIGAG
jgi:hypothetical protein